MTDYDALDHGISWKWKRSFDLIKDGAAPTEVAMAAIRALTATLRHEGGLSALDELTCIAEHVISGRESGGDALAQVKRAERTAGGTDHIRDAVHVTKQLIIEIAQGAIPLVSCREEICERFCRHVIEQKCFARARSRLIGEAWSTYAEQAMWQAEIREALKEDLAKIVQCLIRDPSGKTVIAPRHPRVKPIPIDVLLNTPLDE